MAAGAMALAVIVVLGLSWLGQGAADGERHPDQLNLAWDYVSPSIHWEPRLSRTRPTAVAPSGASPAPAGLSPAGALALAAAGGSGLVWHLAAARTPQSAQLHAAVPQPAVGQKGDTAAVLGVPPKAMRSLLAVCGLLLASVAVGVRVRSLLKSRHRGRKAPTLWSDKLALTSRQMKLVWQLPGDRSVKVDRYDLERVPGGEVVYSGSNTWHLEQGLSPVTHLQFRVRAAIGSSPGDWSDVVSETTLPMVPEAPSLWEEPSGAAATAVQVIWTDPAANGAPISAYRLQKRQHGSAGEWALACEGTATHCLVDHLQPETSYDFRVAARNAVGWSPWSAECTSKTAALKLEPALLVRNSPTKHAALELSGSFNTDGPTAHAACISRLQESADQESWATIAESCKQDVMTTLEDRYLRIVVEHPSGLKRTTDPLRVRLEVVPDEQLTQENLALQQRAEELRHAIHRIRLDAWRLAMQQPQPA